MINNKKAAKKREKKIAKDIEGKAHVGSGCFWNLKADASDENFLIEDKFTEESKYSLKLKELNKLEYQAKRENKIPVFRFGFVCGTKSIDFAVLRKQDCVYDYSINNKITNYKKSVTIYSDFLIKIYQNCINSIFLELDIYEKEFMVIFWDDFLNNKENIIEGKSI